ncbi:hypothetical protein LB559_32345 [Mesorhizobium sp. BR1-1-3]|uniref:hypothetical protein n=1 Tax=Mesorhizobium sp. BR1-1-3 TaxID=2876651 RepID=UPI001CD186E9|nr:hypothetical protein [Mesorhizobium sp. BR1-1-3]MBZ9892624.1 hypothetical protein [Mesorhizobium sp. BR1-1-3]
MPENSAPNTKHGGEWTIAWRLVVVAAAAINVAMLLAALFVAQIRGLDAWIFYRDPSAAAGVGFYTGWISSLGASLWIGSGAATLFAGLLTRRWDCTFLGGLTLLLGLDDLLLIHEDVLPIVGIPEIVPMIAYAAAGLFWFFRLRRKRFDGTIIFVAAGFLLAMSASIDQLGELFPTPGSAAAIAEDVVKELGIFLWAAGAVGYAAMVTRLGRPWVDPAGPNSTD